MKGARRIRVGGLTLVVLAAWTASAAWSAAYGNPQLLVETEWLVGRLNDPGIRIIDMRSQREEYASGHVPGAVYLGVNETRLALKEPGFSMPPAYDIEEMLGRLGITPETFVVAYDDLGGLNAARLFFTLDYVGHERVALLNGGITKWVAEERPLSRDVPRLKETVYRVRAHTERVAPARWILGNLHRRDVALVDARSPKEFSGEDVRAKRGGRIPGAVNIEWTENLTPKKTFKSADELRALYEKAGVTRDKTVVAYCQTMHRGALAYFTLRLLGYPDVRGYDRSWSEWGNDERWPVEP